MKSTERGQMSLYIGKILSDSASTLAGGAVESNGRAGMADRFGSSQCIRALIPSRSFAMILMKGLKALANPRRLRVLELLKNPAAFDGPRGADGRPFGARIAGAAYM